MKRVSSFAFVLVCLVIGSVFSQNIKRLALVDIESDFLSAEDKAEILNSLRERLLDLRQVSLIRADEIEARLQQKNPVRADVERVQAQQTNKKVEIERSLEQAQKYYLASQFDEAITLLSGSLMALNSAALAMTVDLPQDILRLLAASHFFQGNEPQARYYLSALLDLDSSAVLNAQKYPPSFIELFNQVKSSGRASWEILQLPSNIRNLKAHFMGQSVEIKEGELVSFRLPFHHPVWGSKAVIIEAEGYAPILFTLDKPPSNLNFVSTEDKKLMTKGLFRPVGNSTAPVELKRLVSGLKPDILFLGAAERSENGLLNVEGQWLEEPTGRSSPVVRVNARDIPTAVEKLISQLLDYLSPEGAVLGEKFVPYEERPEMVAETPYYKTWWFWTIVGAAAVGTGLGTYLLLNQNDTVRVKVSPAP